MSTQLFKNGDSTGIATDALSKKAFLKEMAGLFNQLIEEGKFNGDWEFQLERWLTHIDEICRQYSEGEPNLFFGKSIIFFTGFCSLPFLVISNATSESLK